MGCEGALETIGSAGRLDGVVWGGRRAVEELGFLCRLVLLLLLLLLLLTGSPESSISQLGHDDDAVAVYQIGIATDQGDHRLLARLEDRKVGWLDDELPSYGVGEGLTL